MELLKVKSPVCHPQRMLYQKGQVAEPFGFGFEVIVIQKSACTKYFISHMIFIPFLFAEAFRNVLNFKLHSAKFMSV